MKKYFNSNFLIQSFFILLCLISFFSGLVYYFYKLNNLGLIISLILAIISFIIIHYFYDFDKPAVAGEKIQPRKNKHYDFLNFLLLASYFLLFALILYLLYRNRINEAIISPWQVLPRYFFILYFLATLILLINLIKNQPFAILLVIFHYFLSFSIALLVYKLGYGFDPFIHGATLDLIDKTGAVLPKPFYYLGQYGLVIMLHKITNLPLAWLDKLLVPILSAIILPLTLWRTLKLWLAEKKLIIYLLTIILILPFFYFIVSTPQNLTYLILLVIILFGLNCCNLFDLMIIYLLALTALITQPIAGLPAIIFALLLTVYHSDGKKIKKYFYSLFYLLAVLALPLAFYLLNKLPPGAVGGLAQNAATDELLAPVNDNFYLFKNPDKENFILNFIYLYGFNLKILLIFLILTGLIFAYRYRKNCRVLFIYFNLSLALIISYFIAKKIPFNFLIKYEQNDYLTRLVTVIAFFNLPFILIALYAITDKILKNNKAVKVIFLFFLASLITTSLYLSYPRFDNYFNSRGFSVSVGDIEAVRWIKNDAKSDYIVLANQQVSAAALREYGFSHYFNDSIFYYPIPTGGPLYQYYLEMVYKRPSRETMKNAMDLVGVDEGYFVLNKYWWAFPKVLEEAKLEATNWQEIDGGNIYIFKYNK